MELTGEELYIGTTDEQNGDGAEVLVSPKEDAEKIKEEDRHSKIDPLTIDPEIRDKIAKQVLPSGDFEILKEFVEIIDRLINSNSITLFKDEVSKNILHSVFSKKNYSAEGIFEKDIRTDDMVNAVNYADKELGIRKVPFSNSKDPEILKAKFTSVIGLGDVVQVPLYHSGFWITIKPAKDSDLLSLQHSINKEILSLGRSTQTMIHSNYSVIYNRLVCEFILDHVINATINVELDKLMNYIDPNDIELLVIGMISALYPDGYNYSRNCRNILIFKESGEPKCTDYITGKINPLKTMFVNRKVFNNSTLSHMAKRTPGSVTVDEVIEYKKSITRFEDTVSEITGTNGVKFEIVYSNPSLEDYIHKGQSWVDEVIVLAEELFSATETEEGKNRKVIQMMYTMVLGIYGSYIKCINVKETDISITSYLDILETLHTLSTDNHIVNTIVDDVKKHISKSTIAVVAIPNYTCPTCKEEQLANGEEVNNDLKELIPLNMLESFFDLCVMRLAR